MCLLDTKETALLIRCSVSTLKKSRLTGEMFNVTAPPYKKMGKSVRYDKAEVQAWLNQFKSQTSTAQSA